MVDLRRVLSSVLDGIHLQSFSSCERGKWQTDQGKNDSLITIVVVYRFGSGL